MGVISLIGLKPAFMFFGKKTKLLGSAFFFLGLVMIIIGWSLFTLLGFVAQLYGLYHLFRSFLTTIFAYCQTLPVIGPFLRSSPLIHKTVNALAEGSTSGSKKKAKFEV